MLIPLPTSLPEWLPREYRESVTGLHDLNDSELPLVLRFWIRTDLWFLLRFVLNRLDMQHPWLYARTREVQTHPDGHVDLWARDHRKSSIITFAKTIQDILASHGEDPLPEWNGLEPTFGIFSHTRPIAKGFLRQVKREFEGNGVLKELFPDVLYERPDRESACWSEDNGIVVKRRSNPKEATIEAWGLIDGQPTGKHFNVLLYDDVVVRESVTTPDMIQKTTDAWSNSLNLGDAEPRIRVIGTRWHFADTYRTMMERGAVKPRIRAATSDGTLSGKPVLLTEEQFKKKVRDMGPYVASAQLLLNPTVDSKQTFRREWVRYFDTATNWRQMNRALLVDPASEKKRTSDYTAIAIVAKAPDGHYYLLDAVRDRLNLRERAQYVIELHKKWGPTMKVGYEKYGLQADIEYLKEVQERENYRFDVMELGGSLSKIDRVNRLIPVFADGSFYVPRTLHRTLYDSKTVDLVNALIEEELLPWPVPVHDDLLDAISRVFDVDLPWPRLPDPGKRDRYATPGSRRGSWMSG